MKREQRLRGVKGYKHPPNCRSVVRGTMWGNPHRVVNDGGSWFVDSPYGRSCRFPSERQAALLAVARFRMYASSKIAADPTWLDPLRRYDFLSCFCRLDMPCHVDTLIELLNDGDPR